MMVALMVSTKALFCLSFFFKPESIMVWKAIREVYAALLAARPHAEMRVSLDMDPMNML